MGGNEQQGQSRKHLPADRCIKDPWQWKTPRTKKKHPTSPLGTAKQNKANHRKVMSTGFNPAFVSPAWSIVFHPDFLPAVWNKLYSFETASVSVLQLRTWENFIGLGREILCFWETIITKNRILRSCMETINTAKVYHLTELQPPREQNNKGSCSRESSSSQHFTAGNF